jgi:UTP--glucose-1-phosphate uridylyltransferase
VAVTDAVVPVAGLGTRLRPLTRSHPKEMLPVGDRPVVQFVVEELEAAGIERLLFVTGAGKRAIEDHFDDPDGPPDGVRVAYTRQGRPRGLGDAVGCAEGFAGDRPVVVALGDTILGRHILPGIVPRLVEAFESAGAVAAVAVEEVAPDAVGRYGIVAPDGDGEVVGVTDLIEKPEPGTAPSRLAVAARYVLAPAVLRELRATPPDHRGEIQLTDALAALARRGERIVAVRLRPEERRYDVGTVEGYCATFLELALTDPRFGARLRSRARALLDEAGE